MFTSTAERKKGFDIGVTESECVNAASLHLLTVQVCGYYYWSRLNKPLLNWQLRNNSSSRSGAYSYESMQDFMQS